MGNIIFSVNNVIFNHKSNKWQPVKNSFNIRHFPTTSKESCALATTTPNRFLCNRFYVRGIALCTHRSGLAACSWSNKWPMMPYPLEFSHPRSCLVEAKHTSPFNSGASLLRYPSQSGATSFKYSSLISRENSGSYKILDSLLLTSSAERWRLQYKVVWQEENRSESFQLPTPSHHLRITDFRFRKCSHSTICDPTSKWGTLVRGQIWDIVFISLWIK